MRRSAFEHAKSWEPLICFVKDANKSLGQIRTLTSYILSYKMSICAIAKENRVRNSRKRSQINIKTLDWAASNFSAADNHRLRTLLIRSPVLSLRNNKADSTAGLHKRTDCYAWLQLQRIFREIFWLIYLHHSLGEVKQILKSYLLTIFKFYLYVLRHIKFECQNSKLFVR